MPQSYAKILLVFVILTLTLVFFLGDVQRFVSLEELQSHKQELLDWYHSHQVLFVALFILCYTLMAALSFPGATVFTLAGGAIFGFTLGTIYASIAATLGATLAFLSARYLFRESLNRRFGEKLRQINEGFTRERGFYLFSLRVFPIFPFFVVNLLMGLTSIRVRTFIGLSQLGMLPGTMVFAYAGTQLMDIEKVRDVMSPGLWIAFGLMGLLPFVSQKLLQLWKRKRMALEQ